MTCTASVLNIDTRNGDTTAQSNGTAVFAFPTDANYTLLAAQYTQWYLNITAGVITAGRSIIVPLVAGASYVVRNNTAQTVTIIGATGTGIAIATTKSAIVICDGTNWLRVTADV